MKHASEKGALLKERRWERGWEEHESLQRRRLSHLSLSEKLRWLEQAQRMVCSLKASRPASVDHRNPHKDEV
ncbi:MAG: hypothetical protein JW793_00300 [Acidobacteria bacterium]|nr:hypothetical protein [Acidobacteriota bacterium]